MQNGTEDELDASAMMKREKPAFASFVEPSSSARDDGLKFDIKDELNEKLSARLDQAM